jgi:hypothetical protein
MTWDYSTGLPVAICLKTGIPRDQPPYVWGLPAKEFGVTMGAMTALVDPVAIYEETRRWGNRVGHIRVGIRLRWNRWMMRHGGGDVRRLRFIALRYGVDDMPRH